MDNSAYWRRRVVSWVARKIAAGLSRPEVFDAAAKRKPPMPDAAILAAFPAAEQAVKNADLLNLCPDDMRLCDIPGFLLPPKGNG